MRNPDKLAETGSRASEGWSHYKTPDTRPSRFATYLIDLEHRFVLVKFTGTVTFHDIEEYALRLRRSAIQSKSFRDHRLA
jgi:hypothetical protein